MFRLFIARQIIDRLRLDPWSKYPGLANWLDPVNDVNVERRQAAEVRRQDRRVLYMLAVFATLVIM